VAPGGQNDVAAYRKSTLPDLINNLPISFYIIGDNAYVCSEHVLTPFSGESRKNPTKDTYNYYISQLRTRIEMAFGLLTTKWRILRSPLQLKLDNVGELFLSITRLHNFCINERLDNNVNINTNNNYYDEDNNGDPEFWPSDVTATTIIGYSMMRTLLLEKIVEEGLSRPYHNTRRNDHNRNKH
jgi:DDE superfamily endonuclease